MAGGADGAALTVRLIHPEGMELMTDGWTGEAEGYWLARPVWKARGMTTHQLPSEPEVGRFVPYANIAFAIVHPAA